MRTKGPIIADQTIEGSSLSISICYTSPLAQEADAPTVASSEQSGMDEEIDLLLFSNPLDDENEITVPSSSPSGSQSPDSINNSLIQQPHPRPCPSDLNWRQGHFGYPESQTSDHADLMCDIFTGVTTPDDDLGVTQSKLTSASNSLSSNSYHASMEGPGNTISVVKPRTRRRLKPIPLTGPNPHGRGGKQRCEHCRNQRQGCEYESLDLPCKCCQRRGVPCVNKRWPPKKVQTVSQGDTSPSTETLSIPEVPATPHYKQLNSREWLYIEEFQSYRHPEPYLPKLIIRSRLGVGLYIGADLNPHSSNLYRIAVLVLMSHLKNDHPSNTACYLRKYTREAQDCINNTSLVELVYASYVVTIYSIVGGASLEVAFKCCRQFCKSIVELSRRNRTNDDWIELLWRDALASLYYAHREMGVSISSTNVALMEFAQQWDELLQTSYCLLVSDAQIADLPLSMTTEQSYHKIMSLSVYMQIYLDIYLIRVKIAENAEETKTARDCLCSILDRIIRLISRLPNISDYIYDTYLEPTSQDIRYNPASNGFLHFPEVLPRALKATAEPRTRDTALALLYAFSRLLKPGLVSPAYVDESVMSEVYRSAIAICRLCANLPMEWARDALLVKRSLFWAGLILTKSKLSDAHLWIKNRLQDCIRTGYHFLTVIDNENEVVDEFFRKTDLCTSIKDIWKVAAGDVSLFYYTSSLVTWFLAIDLVRFEHKPHVGRSLETL